eukprot:747289-Hanusia_phi.AAC.1
MSSKVFRQGSRILCPRCRVAAVLQQLDLLQVSARDDSDTFLTVSKRHKPNFCWEFIWNGGRKLVDREVFSCSSRTFRCQRVCRDRVKLLSIRAGRHFVVGAHADEWLISNFQSAWRMQRHDQEVQKVGAD